jgi:hypothetical protein
MIVSSLLEVAGFELRFAARAQMRLTGYTGSAWRGDFGRALRRAACMTGLETCADCPLLARCVYPYVFETPGGPDAGMLAAYDRVPNPFVPAPLWDDVGTLEEAGEGRFADAVRASDRACRDCAASGGGGRAGGLGPDRVPRELVAIQPIPPPPAKPFPDLVAVELLSPLQLVEKGRLVGPEALRPRHLLLALLHGVPLLAQLHGRRCQLSITAG